MTEVVPDGLPTVGPRINFFQDGVYYDFGRTVRKSNRPPDAITLEDWVAFLHRLSQSKHGTASSYGRYGWVMHQWYFREQLKMDHQGLQKLYTDINGFLRDFRKMEFTAPSRRSRSGESIYTTLHSILPRLQYELTRSQATNNPRPQPRTSDNRPPDWESNPKLWRIHGYPKTLGKLRFEPLELQIRTLDGKQEQFLVNRRWQGYSGWGSVTQFLRCTTRWM